MDESFLREHTARCRQLADISTDPFIKKRLLDLADRYDDRLLGKPLRASQLIKPPVAPLGAPSLLPGER